LDYFHYSTALFASVCFRNFIEVLKIQILLSLLSFTWLELEQKKTPLTFVRGVLEF